MAAVIRPRVPLHGEAGRAVDRRRASARAMLVVLLPVLLLSGGMAAFPAGAEDGSPAPPSMLIGLDVLDTSRPPAGGNWVVLAAEDASWRDQGGDRWQDFQQGQVLMPGSEIETGPDGEVILVVGGDQVRIAPSTRLMLPAVAGNGQRLRHERGRLRVDVEPRAGRDFEVTTPLLSLGIKGTSFETAVDPQQDRVVVLDGEVEVRPVGRDEALRLNEGQGLRQPAAPGAEPLPFEIPAARAEQARGDPTFWHLQGEPRADLTSERAVGTGDAAVADGASGSKGRDRPAADSSAWSWAGESTSLLIVAALAAAVVLLLAAPVIALCHNVFEHWLGRPATGRRRRELTRG